ncbi:anti-sigma factor antagonist [Streptomyces sp. S3(2020)]|uniref:anti-sigma factor antagonist n=1 Tax=Streptomyces sp. S3(2020) TaxID=2732044 RepID=UPI001489A6D6|nr:anti-sigma factor antagonist [Streptomyces sp. S3(2020)]NNN34556.1 anti-sigma factor antagonist [Streptomyces sp. S3(2020)]
MPKSARCCGGPANGCTSLAGHGGTARLTVCARADGDRTVVTVRGDLDLSADQGFQRALRSALTDSGKGIDLDLGGVEFCDCSGLNALLGIRQQALDQSKTVTIHTISPAAARVFTLTGTLPLFDPEADADQEEDAARVEVVQLRRAMQTRGLIDLARGILMATFTLTAEEAWHVLVTTSQNTNTKLHRTAQQLVNSIHAQALPEATRTQLSTAVTQVIATRGRTEEAE